MTDDLEVKTCFQKLNKLDKRILNGHRMRLLDIAVGRFIEECNFRVFLEAEDGALSESQAFVGKFFSGRGRWLTPWIELAYYPQISFPNGNIIDLSGTGEEQALFIFFSKLIPGGGKIFVQYEELKGDDTRKALELGIPAPATRIGLLLWNMGCRWFKDWYYPEGGLEGGAKLQGNKPANAEIAREHESEIKKELEDFIAFETDEPAAVFEPARKRAIHILQQLG